ncbi:rho GTPase-activating protein 17b isoform X3 [Stegastes partitus]|uniref:Rho GTPase-activating protein 17 n=1 Tax=Stegastes partitus TaxID=144197 RepID=A0A3B5AIU1_9TELE|nr:PREDICTED: rho GTPase-activating protein 17-like isoform X3 [Stegastes partitus]
MKKQFNRMRQLANQTVGRAEKTEVLSDDLLQIERRMELVRLVSHNTHKRLVSCLQGQLGTDTEKRHKKLPLTALSQAMQEGGGQLGDESLIGKMMDVCGEAESRLATDLMQHELQLERDILEPLNQLAEVEIPNILKQRKQLAKLVLDYDSAKTRWYQATKSSNQAMAAKVDSLKDEMEEALNKVEICKDQLSADMYNFASKEGEYARYYVMLLEAQADYHRRSLAALEAAIPTIQTQQDSWMEKPAFGTALEEHLKRSNREIALPIEACVMMLLETGMKEEGLFRIAAGASKLKKLKAALDCSTSQLEEFYSDPHAVAGALKSYLRELPEPLMTFGLYDEWIQASNVSDPDKRLQALWVTCDCLPKTHKANLRYLVKFLAKLAQDSEVNKMTPSNISIVLGPNLLWSNAEGSLAEMAAATSVHVVSIIELIIQHADWFFPDEVDFNVSGMFAMPTHPATPDPEFGLDRKRPGSLGHDGDSHTPRKDSPARELTSTPPPQRNGSSHLLGAPHSQGGSRGPSPHMSRRGTKKQAPAPPKQASPFASGPSNTQTPGSPHHPPITPRRLHSKEGLIHAPSHPPPQPPQAQQAQGESEPSPPSTPTPPDTPPHDGSHSNPLSYHSGSLPRPSRPAPRPRPRPSMPPPPQPDNGNGVCGSASKIITDGGLVLKGTGRAFIPEVIADQPEESSAGQEPPTTTTTTTTLALQQDPDINSESTAL